MIHRAWLLACCISSLVGIHRVSAQIHVAVGIQIGRPLPPPVVVYPAPVHRHLRVVISPVPPPVVVAVNPQPVVVVHRRIWMRLP
ncbi:MAG: hypothetical protein K6T34_06910 [Thermoflavifilum sp.]|nr:hypothetical protein [Thermoflavifilum sp.]